MSARTTSTGCALALLALTLTASAAAAPRPLTAKSARTVTRPKAIAAVSAPVPVPAPTPPPAPAALEPTQRDQPPAEPSPLQHRATITLNPLALAIGRYGANAEFVVAPHHAVAASGYYQTFPTGLIRLALPDLPVGAGPAPRFGGELGYRLYTGSRGPTGLFVGPSFVAVPLAAPRLTEDYRAEVVSFTALGAALDVGVQAVVGPGFTIGGGVGVMALAYTPPASASPPAGFTLPSYPEPHVLPRLLVMAGWAF